MVVVIVPLPRHRLPEVFEEMENIGRDKNCHDLFENTRGLHDDEDDNDEEDSNGDEQPPSDSNIGDADGINGFGSPNSNEDDCFWCE